MSPYIDVSLYNIYIYIYIRIVMQIWILVALENRLRACFRTHEYSTTSLESGNGAADHFHCKSWHDNHAVALDSNTFSECCEGWFDT